MIHCQVSLTIFTHFCRLSLPWYTLFSCIVGVFNNICCRSLKSAKRFSIANNCKKQTKLKEHEIKTGTKKKARSKTRQNREKPNFKLFVIRKSPKFLKGPILTAIGVTLFVTRWWQALTISYLTDSFEIIIMPKEIFFGTIMANKFKSSF